MEGWRSEPMCRIQLFIQSDAARDTVDELGRDGFVQFIDVRRAAGSRSSSSSSTDGGRMAQWLTPRWGGGRNL